MKAFRLTIPAVFVTTALFAQSALEKYRACRAPNPAVNISLREAREVKAKLAADGFDVRGGLWCNETRSGAVVAQSVSEADLVRDGFPEDVPINLTIRGANDHHSVAGIKKQMDYGWGYWTFFGKWIVRMWW